MLWAVTKFIRWCLLCPSLVLKFNFDGYLRTCGWSVWLSYPDHNPLGRYYIMILWYNMILHTSLQELRQDINQKLNTQKTPHTSVDGPAMGCLSLIFWRKLTVITAPHCIWEIMGCVIMEFNWSLSSTNMNLLSCVHRTAWLAASCMQSVWLDLPRGRDCCRMAPIHTDAGTAGIVWSLVWGWIATLLGPWISSDWIKQWTKAY